MSTTQSLLKPVDFSQLMRAAEGFTQWRVLGLSFVTWLAGSLVMAGGQMLALRFASGLLSLLFLMISGLVFSVGMSAVGILLQDKAKNLEPRSTSDALAAGLLCVPRFIGFGLLALAAALVLCVVAAVVYFICKLPVLGPVLLFVAHPVMVIAASLLFIAWFWVITPLLAPALWDGRSLKSAATLVVAVVRMRLVPLVLMLLALYVVVSVVVMVLLSGLMPGFFAMTAIASGTIGSQTLAPIGLLGAMASNGHLVAGTLSSTILLALLMTLTMQVALMGINLIYLMVSDGLDEQAAEHSLQAGLAVAREKARQAQERARQTADKLRESAEKLRQTAQTTQAAQTAAPASDASASPQTPPPASASVPAPTTEPSTTVKPEEKTPIADVPIDKFASNIEAVPAAAQPPLPPAAAPAPRCSECFDVVDADDMFCEHCGHKLR